MRAQAVTRICPDCGLREMTRKWISFRPRPWISKTMWNCECGCVRLYPCTFADAEWECARRIATRRAAHEKWQKAGGVWPKSRHKMRQFAA